MVAWRASRVAAVDLALLAVEQSTGRQFIVDLDDWRMLIVVECPWWAAPWLKFVVRRAASRALARINVPVSVSVKTRRILFAWEPQL
jgi:hypothetical protein